MKPKPTKTDGADQRVHSEDLAKARNSAECLRVAIEHMRHPKVYAGIYPENTASWMASKANEVASFLSQSQLSILTPPESHKSAPSTTNEDYKPSPPACMDFLISSGVEKVIQTTIKEIQVFQGLEAPLIQRVLQSQEFADWLNVLLSTTRQVVKKNPKFLNNFEHNVGKRLLVWIIKAVQKSMDHNLRQQFAL